MLRTEAEIEAEVAEDLGIEREYVRRVVHEFLTRPKDWREMPLADRAIAYCTYRLVKDASSMALFRASREHWKAKAEATSTRDQPDESSSAQR